MATVPGRQLCLCAPVRCAHPWVPFLATLLPPRAIGAAVGLVFLQGRKEHHASVRAKVLLTGAFAATAVHCTHHHPLAALSPGS